MFANKRNLVRLTEADTLRTWGVAQDLFDIVLQGVPKTALVTTVRSDELWAARAKLYQQARTHCALALLPIALAGVAYLFVSRRPIPVKVSQVAENVPVRVFGLGTVEARVLSKIGFEVGAALTELNGDHGDLVKQGQVLHTTQQEAKVARSKAAVLSAEASVKKADANITKARAILAQKLEVNRRKQQLVSRQVTSAQVDEEAQRDEDVAKADVLVAESDIEVANAQLADARSQLAYEMATLDLHTLVAPFDASSLIAKKSSERSSRRVTRSSPWSLRIPYGPWPTSTSPVPVPSRKANP